MPRVGGTTVSFTPRSRQNGQELLEQLLAELAAGDDDAVDDPCELVELLAQRRAALDPPAISAWMSGKSSSLRTTAWASGPSPTMSSAARGVIRRQSARIAGAEAEAETEHRAPDEQPVVELRSRAGNGTSRTVRSAVLLSVHTMSHGSSSTVRWRSVRWSRS